jgi:outer membrane protein OmpA-like peptidoglycan-associated protein
VLENKQAGSSPAESHDRSARRFRVLLAARILVFASLTALFLWYGETRLRQMELRLRTAEEKAGSVNRQVLQFSRELELLRQHTVTAQREASQAKQQASESIAARRQLELEAERARNEALEARGELDRFRQAREQELDRMQEALNRVAPTRRTPSGMVIQLSDESFRFDFDSAALRPENRELLSRIAGILLASNGYSLFVYGHTDDVGTDEYNQNLSEKRAQSVQDYLVQAGIPAELVRTKGFGKSSPLVKETTRAAREKNRRVEIGIVDTIIEYERETR